MTNRERERLTKLLTEVDQQIAWREANRPSGATLANPSFRKLVEQSAYLTALLR